MDKSQGLYSFWSSFGLPAYDELTVPDDAVMPYITYQNVTDSLGMPVSLNGSVWYHSTSWADIDHKVEEIARYIGEYGHTVIKLDTGYLYLTKGNPFAQRLADATNRMIRRVYINISAEYLTAY